MSRYLIEECAYKCTYKEYFKARKKGVQVPLHCVYKDFFIIEKRFVQPSKDMEEVVRSERKKVYSYLLDNNILDYSYNNHTTLEREYDGEKNFSIKQDKYFLRIYCQITPLEDNRSTGNYGEVDKFLTDMETHINKKVTANLRDKGATARMFRR